MLLGKCKELNLSEHIQVEILVLCCLSHVDKDLLSG